jgi:hypothetical protein
MIAKGTFQVQMTAEPPFDVVDGVSLGRAQFDKQFSGPLEATGRVQMLAARTPRADSAGYVAVERISGTLHGRRGTFVVLHTGLADRGARTLAVTVVPDSGTGDLQGLAGRMTIEITNGQHFYELVYTLPAAV